jgi:hypothetical protein
MMSNMKHDLFVPEGWVRFDGTIYTNGSDIVLTGDTPPDEAPELAHDCDVMGCGSVSPHVVGKGTIDWDNHEWRSKEIADILEGNDAQAP